jgi:hypothetical protein
VRRARAAAVGLIAVATVGPTALAAATGGSQAITATSIAGARLGAAPGDYRRVLGPVDYRTRLPHGLLRLTFRDGEVHVFLRDGRGVAIETATKGFHTARGIGPCTSTARLKTVYGRRLVAHRRPHNAQPFAYEAGSLAFFAPGSRIGNVLLAKAPSQYLSLLAASPACGMGEVD